MKFMIAKMLVLVKNQVVRILAKKSQNTCIMSDINFCTLTISQKYLLLLNATYIRASTAEPLKPASHARAGRPVAVWL